MLNKCALLCTEQLKKYCAFSNSETEIYIYGFELLFSTLLSMCSILFISIIFGHISYAFFFFLFFFTQRLFCSGYHANTYIKCFVITNLIFVSTIFLTNLTILFNIKWVMPILFFLSTIVIWIFSPVKHKNHPCSEKTYIKNKIISRILSLVFFFFYICIYYPLNSEQLIINSAWSYSWVSILIIIEIIKQKGEKTNVDSIKKDC